MELEQYSTTSPFDSIRQVAEDGAEHWSARELMPLLGYDRWENFAAAIDRACLTVSNQGQDPADLFRGVTKKGAGRPQQDFQLSRYAAYLIAMNGDPRKSEVAAAQSYFAVRTREAEMAHRFELPQTKAEALRAYASELEAREAAEAQMRELEPKAESYDRFISGDGTYAVGSVAKILGLSQNKLFDLLRNEGVFIAKGAMRNTPYQRHMHHFVVRAYEFERSDGTPGTSYTTRVQPNGLAFIARKLGLTITEQEAA